MKITNVAVSMNTPQWTDDLSVGDAGIDAQHQEIFNLIKRLESGEGNISYAFEKLDNYVHQHFYDEEELLKAVNYPDLEAHIRLHKEFYEWLETMKKAIQTSPENVDSVGQNLQAFLREWLVDHIMYADQAYKSWINK